MRKIEVKVTRRPGSEDIPLPKYITPGSSGMDLYADIDSEFTLAPGQIKMVSTGLSLEIPPGYEAEIRPRSGLAIRFGLTLLNTPGTIDSDYRGVIQLILINLGEKEVTIKRGDRIAQMVFKEVVRAELNLVEKLSKSIRDGGGFGHSGI